MRGEGGSKEDGFPPVCVSPFSLPLPRLSTLFFSWELINLSSLGPPCSPGIFFLHLTPSSFFLSSSGTLFLHLTPPSFSFLIRHHLSLTFHLPLHFLSQPGIFTGHFPLIFILSPPGIFLLHLTRSSKPSPSYSLPHSELSHKNNHPPSHAQLPYLPSFLSSPCS